MIRQESDISFFPKITFFSKFANYKPILQNNAKTTSACSPKRTLCTRILKKNRAKTKKVWALKEFFFSKLPLCISYYLVCECKKIWNQILEKKLLHILLKSCLPKLPEHKFCFSKSRSSSKNLIKDLSWNCCDGA